MSCVFSVSTFTLVLSVSDFLTSSAYSLISAKFCVQPIQIGPVFSNLQRVNKHSVHVCACINNVKRHEVILKTRIDLSRQKIEEWL